MNLGSRLIPLEYVFSSALSDGGGGKSNPHVMDWPLGFLPRGVIIAAELSKYTHLNSLSVANLLATIVHTLAIVFNYRRLDDITSKKM